MGQTVSEGATPVRSRATWSASGGWLTCLGLVAALIALLAPAIWNGFPLLQYDTGGYIARWYEGYLVPSRSTAFGIFLKAGEALQYWPAVIAQAVLSVWVISLVTRVFGLAARWCVAAFIGALCVTTSLPWLTSNLLTDIFAGLGVLGLYLVVVQADALRRWEIAALMAMTGFAAATHSASFAVLLFVLAAGALGCSLGCRLIPLRGLIRGSAAIALGAAMLLIANFALSGRVVWTPGGYGIAFGRMLQDGIVVRYLREHCPDKRLRLCDHIAELPKTADEFLWGEGVFNDLGRFAGLGEEMHLIVRESLAAYPWTQIRTALEATLAQLAMNATGEGVHNHIWHTYGIIERFVPAAMPAMRAARQQRGELDFRIINGVHVPVALMSFALVLAMVLAAGVRRRLGRADLLAAATLLAVLSNACVCAVVSGPHDRYGARLGWVATLVVGMALMRLLATRPSRGVSFALTASNAGQPTAPV